MYHYLFTNDLRISRLNDALLEAGIRFKTNTVPSATDDKNTNNNMNTLGFYFNLTNTSNCALAASKGSVRKVILNFIKKFQFPNPRTEVSMNDAISDGITIAPMRIIVQTLYIMRMMNPSEAFLSRKEITDFIFFNDSIAKTERPDVVNLASTIINTRKSGEMDQKPDDDILQNNDHHWKHCERQIREMVKILCWTGCIIQRDNECIEISHDNLSKENEADLFEIMTFTGLWKPDPKASFNENKVSYQNYMDIEYFSEKDNGEGTNNKDEFINTSEIMKLENKKFAFTCVDLMKEHNLLTVDNLNLLSDKDKCVTMFRHNNYHGIFFKLDSDVDEGEQKIDSTGMVCYYADNYDIEGEKYAVSSEWEKVSGTDDSRILFVNWIIKQLQQVKFETGYSSEFSRNRILFGAPGTGKSYTLNEDRKKLLAENKDVDYERVTFHPDYSYANFVGTYKPVPIRDDDGNDSITYEYVPGPFLRVYVNALKNSKTLNIKPYLLIIEEINRANVAAVFGDVFQLLDRHNNVSEYPIMPSQDMKEYLAKPEVLGGVPEDYNIIKIPDNMFIWATMNSADQGVFPMDTAFKRRWDFTYLGIDDAVSQMSKKIKENKYILGTNTNARLVKWDDLRCAINDVLSSDVYNINEDKLLGPYFISKSVLESDEIEFKKVFKNKVLMYLFDDAVKQKRKLFFENCKEENKGIRYSLICKKFDELGVFIFPNEISCRFKNVPNYNAESEVIDG